MDLQPLDDPFHPPSWRWARVAHLVDRGRCVSNKWDDPWIKLAVRYARQWRTGARAADRKRLVRRFPHISAAHAIYRDASVARWVLEARLLAGESSDAIAAKCGLLRSVVDAFHALFFHVRHRLAASHYICRLFYGIQFHTELAPKNVAMTLKWVAYARGPSALDRVIRNLDNYHSVLDLYDLTNPDDRRHLCSHLRLRAAILAVTLPRDSRSIAKESILPELLRSLKDSATEEPSTRVATALQTGSSRQSEVARDQGNESEGATASAEAATEPGTGAWDRPEVVRFPTDKWGSSSPGGSTTKIPA